MCERLAYRHFLAASTVSLVQRLPIAAH